MKVNRRKFIERMGLGAGACLLNPFADGLIAEAFGQAAPRKRIVFFLTGNGTAPYYFTPSGIDPGGLDSWSAVAGTKGYAWPGMVASLEKYRDRMLLIDGLPNRIPESQHSAGFGALSMIPVARGQAEYGGPPGGITIDQWIAGKMGTGTPVKSILCGVGKGVTTVASNVFASGREAPEPAFMSPVLLYRSLFRTLASSAGQKRVGLLLDSMRADLKTLNAALAGPERRKLEQLSAAIEDYDMRQKSLPGLNCKAPASAPADSIDMAPVEDKLTSMVEMVILALSCGMTNVVGIAAACGFGHNAPDYTKLGVTFEGHADPPEQGPAQTKIHNFHSSLIARMADALSAVKEGDKSVFDNTVFVYLNDNGDAHHASHNRYPTVILGDAGGALKSDGRFVRYAPFTRSLADLYCTLAHAVGTPTDTFGMGGVEKVTGPLADLLT